MSDIRIQKEDKAKSEVKRRSETTGGRRSQNLLKEGTHQTEKLRSG